MSKDNITEPVNTWDNFYQSRVCNDSYVNVFCKKYNRFIEEIIINIQQIKRLEFCRDCIDQSYKAGRDEYNRLERMIEELKEKQK